MMSDMVEIARGQGFTAMKVPFVGFTEMPDRQVVDLLGVRELVGDDITLGIDRGTGGPTGKKRCGSSTGSTSTASSLPRHRCATTTLRAIANSQLVRRC